MRTLITMLTVVSALLFVSGCESIGGSRDDRANTPSTQRGEVQGTIERIDPAGHRLILSDTSGFQSSFRADDSSALYYDGSTRVEYQGRQYRPEDLERGDRIRASLRPDAETRVAALIEVVQNANAASASRSMHGTVRNVDTRSRTIELDSAYMSQSFDTRPRSSTTISYDDRTVVEYQGRRYDVTNLERGDVVEIDVDSATRDLPLARRIVVARSS